MVSILPNRLPLQPAVLCCTPPSSGCGSSEMGRGGGFLLGPGWVEGAPNLWLSRWWEWWQTLLKPRRIAYSETNITNISDFRKMNKNIYSNHLPQIDANRKCLIGKTWFSIELVHMRVTDIWCVWYDRGWIGAMVDWYWLMALRENMLISCLVVWAVDPLFWLVDGCECFNWHTSDSCSYCHIGFPLHSLVIYHSYRRRPVCRRFTYIYIYLPIETVAFHSYVRLTEGSC